MSDADESPEDLVWNHLAREAAKSRSMNIHPFTKQGISDATGLPLGEVSDALKKLEDGKVEHLVHTKVYLPDTRGGDVLWHRLVRAGLVSRSPFTAMFIVFALAWIVASNVPDGRVSEAAPGEAKIYLKGFADAIFYMAIPGLMAAGVLRHYWSRHLHWTARNAALDAKVRGITKASAFAGGTVVVGYLAYCWWTATQMEFGVVAASFSAGAPAGWAYWELVHRSSRRRNEDA